MTYTIPPATRAPGQLGYIADQNNTADVLTGMGAGWNPLNTAYGPADPTGATDSAPALNATLAAAAAKPGTVPWLSPGTYRIDSPVYLPPATGLEGRMGAWTSAAGTTMPAVTLKPSGTFAGAAAVIVQDAHLGGYAAQNTNAQLRHLVLDGSAAPAGVHGIQLSGPVWGITLEDLCIRAFGGNGIATVQDAFYAGQNYPYGIHASRVKVDGCGATGIGLNNTTDSTWYDVQVIGCGANGWTLSGGGHQLIACRSEWNGSAGYSVSAAGPHQFVGCRTDRNAASGWVFSGTGNYPVTMTGCRAGRDVSSGSATGAGVRVNGAAYPIVIDGLVVYPGVNDDGTGLSTPVNAVQLTGTPLLTALTGCLLHGNTTGLDVSVNPGAYSLRAVYTRTGAIGSPTAPALAADTA